MVKINFKQWTRDHCWFGWHYAPLIIGTGVEYRWIRILSPWFRRRIVRLGR